MKIKFKDLFYMDDDEDKDDAKCEIDVRDVKVIMANQDGTFLIENMDGVFYKTDFVEFNEEMESKLFVKANNAKSCPMCGSQDIYIEEFDRDVIKLFISNVLNVDCMALKILYIQKRIQSKKQLNIGTQEVKSVLYIGHLFIITFIKGLLKRKRW